MQGWLAVLVACLIGAGVYCVLRPNLLRALFGIVLLSNGVNLSIFAVRGGRRSAPVLLGPDGGLRPDAVADPLPQALVLTAIVIGLGLVAFALVLARLQHRVVGTLALDPDAEHDEQDEALHPPPAGQPLPERGARSANGSSDGRTDEPGAPAGSAG